MKFQYASFVDILRFQLFLTLLQLTTYAFFILGRVKVAMNINSEKLLWVNSENISYYEKNVQYEIYSGEYLSFTRIILKKKLLTSSSVSFFF